MMFNKDDRCLGFHLVFYRQVKLAFLSPLLPWLPPRFIDFDAGNGGFLFRSWPAEGLSQPRGLTQIKSRVDVLP